MIAFARTATRLGFGAIEINYVVPPEGVEQLLQTRGARVSSLHSPTPRVLVNEVWSDALNLASADDEERKLAVERAQATIDHAARAGAGRIVVHLGAIAMEGGMFEEEVRLRRLYDERVRDGEEVEALRQAAQERRREAAGRFFPHARRSLEEIAEHAARFGVAVGLENRYHFHEFPLIEEMRELLAGYPPDVVGFWLDMGHAEVMERLGLVRKESWLEELRERCIGVHVHDIKGLADHQPPGHGTADWAHFTKMIPPGIPRVLEINQKTPAHQVAASIPFLRGLGLIP